VKILYLGRYNLSEELTGPEKVAKRIYNESSKTYEASFVEYFFNGAEYGIKKKLFGYENIDKDKHIYRLGIFEVISFFLRFRPEIIHIMTFERFAVLAFFYKVFSRVKIIYNVHGVAAYENVEHKNVSSALKLKDSFCEKLFMKFSDKLLFLSENQFGIAKKYYQIKKEKVKIINNGIDEEFKRGYLRENNPGVPSLLFIGDSDRKDKNFDCLYSILENIKIECNLYIIGNFNTSRFETQVGKVNIIPAEKMDTASLVKFLSDKDIFISSSSYDTFSIATAECMSMGLVPVVTDTTGISKLIKDGENGFIVKHDNGTALADKINILLDNKNVRKKMAVEASKIYSLLKWDSIFASYQKIYKEVC